MQSCYYRYVPKKLFTLFLNHILCTIFSGIERKNIETKIPIAEVVTCAGFLFVCFLEELIHHFVHPHKKSTKAKKNVIEKNGTTTLNEFEMYDAKLKGKFVQEHGSA